MTRGTFDLYWVAVHSAHRGAGVGRLLVAHMESELRAEGARLIRVETEGNAEYAATRLFYERIGYEVAARVRDFYDEGNDLFIWSKYLRR
jgi:ribosomal protein S18 acetylase RimI-like enzyme